VDTPMFELKQAQPKGAQASFKLHKICNSKSPEVGGNENKKGKPKRQLSDKK